MQLVQVHVNHFLVTSRDNCFSEQLIDTTNE